MIKKKRIITKKRLSFKTKKPLYQKRFFWLLVLSFFMGVGLFYLVVFSPIFQIKEIKISGCQKISEQAILELVEGQIQKRIVWPTKSIFLFKAKNIEKAIAEKFILIDMVQLKRKLPAVLLVTIKERTPLAVFCSPQEECFLVDENGIAFEKSREGANFFVSFNEEVSLAQSVISPENFQSILMVKKGLNQDLEMETERFFVDGRRLNIKTKEGFEIYFNLENDIEEQLFNLEMVLKEKISAEEREKLEYIDLRFGNRVYYK